MAKSEALNQTQSIKTQLTVFRPSDLLSIITVSPNSNGSNLTSGLRTFTAAIGSGTLKTGGTAASWKMDVSDSRVLGSGFVVVATGDYLTAPTDLSTNAATVDSGSSNATWTLTAGILKNIYTAGANDSVIKSINVASLDSAARIMTLYLTDASNTCYSFLAAINIPATAGTGSGTTASIDLLGGTLIPSLPYDSNGKRVLPMQAGYKLWASVPAVTAAKLIKLQVLAEAF